MSKLRTIDSVKFSSVCPKSNLFIFDHQQLKMQIALQHKVDATRFIIRNDFKIYIDITFSIQNNIFLQKLVVKVAYTCEL